MGFGYLHIDSMMEKCVDCPSNNNFLHFLPLFLIFLQIDKLGMQLGELISLLSGLCSIVVEKFEHEFYLIRIYAGTYM